MANYQYHPNATFKFLYPIDVRHPEEDLSGNGFYSLDKTNIDSSNQGAEVSFQIDEITSNSQIYEKLSLDISIEAKFACSSGKASFSWEREVNISDSSIVYMAYGKKIYNEVTYNGDIDFSEKGK